MRRADVARTRAGRLTEAEADALAEDVLLIVARLAFTAPAAHGPEPSYVDSPDYERLIERPTHGRRRADKWCPTCCQHKPAGQFWASSIRFDGLHFECGVCARRRKRTQRRGVA